MKNIYARWLEVASLNQKAIAFLLITTITVWGIGLGFSTSALADTERSSAPDGAEAYIISPAGGAEVASPVTIQFGLSGMGVAPAGIDIKNTGHHHLLIDVADQPDLDQPLPATNNIKHFGAGQTETAISLDAGSHTLQLLLGNYAHIPHDKPVTSEPITITVK
ncbi:MAG: DUF4399 domain-containing protein [Cyanobacteria bacterium P01_F01_bin.150]